MFKAMNGWVLAVVAISALISLGIPRGETEKALTLSFLQRPSLSFKEEALSHREEDQELLSVPSGLEYDFYRNTCPNAEKIVRSTMTRIYTQQKNVSAALLRLFFHDCFIHGCDASVLLDDSNGNGSYTTEKQAIPNETLRGFDKIDTIKQELERACPGVVSCADVLSLATRDSVVLAGGPFFPVFTGRRDSNQSFYNEAMAEIPKPDDNINRTLHLFGKRGFNERETVSLLGGHNIGKIGCQFIQERLDNFSGTGQPDQTVSPEFLNEMRQNCRENNSSDVSSVSTTSAVMKTPASGISYFQGLSSSISSGAGFDTHYYQSLLKGRGLLYADQQLMANDKTARLVMAYASDDGSTFRMDFARAMVKMSSLNVLTGAQGQVRLSCSSPVLGS